EGAVTVAQRDGDLVPGARRDVGLAVPVEVGHDGQEGPPAHGNTHRRREGAVAPVEHDPDGVRVDARLADNDVGPAVPVDIADGVRAYAAQPVADDYAAGVDHGQGVGLVGGDVADAVAVEVSDVDGQRVPVGHRVNLGSGKRAIAVAVEHVDVCVVPATHGH